MKRALVSLFTLIWAAVAARAVSPGDQVTVRLKDGSRHSGVLVEMTISAVTIDAGGGRQSWDAGRVAALLERFTDRHYAVPLFEEPVVLWRNPTRLEPPDGKFQGIGLICQKLRRRPAS